MSSSNGAKEPPPPPPPPPLPPTESRPGEKIQMFCPKLNTNSSSQTHLNSLKLVEEVCQQSWSVFGQLESAESPLSMVSLYHHCDSIIQSGPTCGLVAIMTCLKLVKPELTTDLTHILKEAQSLGYTKYGEMFSAENMSQFIRQIFKVKVETKQWLEKSMLDVVQHLCQGLPILLPYDADANYEPCLKEGRRAHWATICGFCIASDSSTLLPEQVDFCKVATLEENRFIIHIEPQAGEEKRILHFVKEHLLLPRSRLFVYAKQGKSRRIQIWSFDQLCKSNRNLSKVSSKILESPERVQMIYPESGDLTKSLANQFLLIYK